MLFNFYDNFCYKFYRKRFICKKFLSNINYNEDKFFKNIYYCNILFQDLIKCVIYLYKIRYKFLCYMICE